METQPSSQPLMAASSSTEAQATSSSTEAPPPQDQPKEEHKSLKGQEGWVRQTKAEKKAARAQQLKQKRKAWRTKAKEDRKAKVAQARAEREKMFAEMDEDARKAFLEEEQRQRDQRRLEVEEQNRRVEEAFHKGPRVAFDLTFNDMMSKKEQISLGRQLSRCYAVNRRAAAPVSMYFTGLAQKTEYMLPSPEEYGAWKVHKVDADVTAHFKPEELVYLSPDSDQVLQQLDPSKVYVIGGIIDRTVAKHTSLDKCQKHSLATARLPLQEYAEAGNIHPILTLVAVVEILTAVHHHGDWAAAINQAMPERRVARATADQEERSDESQGEEDEDDEDEAT